MNTDSVINGLEACEKAGVGNSDLNKFFSELFKQLKACEMLAYDIQMRLSDIEAFAATH